MIDKDTEKVKAYLKVRNILRDERLSGNIESCVILIDYENAIAKANLSPREVESLTLRYDKEMDEEEVADRLGVSRRSIRSYLKRAVKKISIFTQFIHEGEQ